MKSKVILFAAIMALLATNCGGELHFRIDYNSSRWIPCQLWDDAFYQLHCFTFKMKPPDEGYVQDVEGAQDVDFTQAVPTHEHNGYVEFENITGVFRAKVNELTSPAILLGPGPLGCGSIDPVGEVKVADIVIDWKIHGEVEFELGKDVLVVEPPMSVNNPLIGHSEYHFDTFDVHDLPDIIDDTILDMVKKSIHKSIDQAVHDEAILIMNLLEGPKEFECRPIDDCNEIPIYPDDEDTNEPKICENYTRTTG